jgi:hypothetical protein
MAAKNNFVVDLMRDFRISTFIVSFITRGFCCFMVFQKGFYVNPDASCRKEKREGGRKKNSDRNRYVYIVYDFDRPICLYR